MLKLLNSEKIFEQLDLEELDAAKLFDAAKLCALEGELDIAMRSLQLSLQTCGEDEAAHPKLSKEDITRVEQVRPHQP